MKAVLTKKYVLSKSFEIGIISGAAIVLSNTFVTGQNPQKAVIDAAGYAGFTILIALMALSRDIEGDEQ